MKLRLMQIFLPDGASIDLKDLLEGREVLGTWKDSNGSDRLVVHLLLPADETEAVMDRFEERFGEHQDFHMVLSPVEAVLPRPQQEKEDLVKGNQGQSEEKPEISEGERISREELYSKATDSLGITRWFMAMTLLSGLVAAVGLRQNSVEVIIGAMVIAPLLGPNVAMALATTLGDMGLLWRAFLTNLVGLFSAGLLATVLGFLISIDPTVDAIANRTQVNFTDIVLALAAGTAGTLAFTLGASEAVIGVMVAVALMPPLVVFGLMLGSGFWHEALGAAMLTAANVICINLSGVATFLWQGVRPRNWWEAKKARRATLYASLVWVGLLAILLGILFWMPKRI